MPKPSANEFNYSALQHHVATAASNLFNACVKAVGNETLYGFAFCPDEDVQSMSWMANSEEALASLTTKLHKQAVKHGSDQTLEQIAEILRFACAEWAYCEETLKTSVPFDSDLGLNQIWSLFRARSVTGVEYDNLFAEVRKQCLNAIAKGLKDFRMNTKLKADFALLVQFPDSGDIPELLRLAKQSNSPQTFRRIKAVCELEE